MFKKVSTYLGSVVLWITLIFLFMFLPRLGTFFQKDSLNVYMWSGIFDPKLFNEFEEKTGVRVNVSYFGGNEELLVKLLATKGKGYDLVMPSDYTVQFLITKKLLKKIDKTKLTFFNDLNPKFLGHYFDPYNDYSLPGDWYVLGLGVNKKYFKNGLPPASWKTIFDPAIMIQNIGLINDSRELINLAIKYKYGRLRPISQPEMREIKALLVEQKKHAEAYTDFRGDFLLESGNCPVVLMGSNYIKEALQENENLVYLIPKEGTFLGLENFVIPVNSNKEDLVYKLLNFLYQPEVQEHNFKESDYTQIPTRKDAQYLFETKELQNVIPLIHPDTPERALPYYNFLTDEQVNEIWLAVKGS